VWWLNPARWVSAGLTATGWGGVSGEWGERESDVNNERGGCSPYIVQ